MIYFRSQIARKLTRAGKMRIFVLTAVLMITTGMPCLSQTTAEQNVIGPAEVEKLKAENGRLKEANSTLEMEKLQAENRQLKEANSKLTQNPNQSQTAKPAKWRTVLHHVGRSMQGALQGAAAGSQIAPQVTPHFAQTSNTTFSNGLTAHTTTY